MTSTAGQKSSRVRTERENLSISDFAKEIQKLEGGSESKNLMIYGRSNVGKTVLAGTCPGKSFWLVGENGWKSAARQGSIGYGRRISDTATALTAIDWLEQRKNGRPRYTFFDWLILDGVSTMQDNFRLGYAAEAFDINPTKRQHRNLPDKPDYFNTQNFLKSWVARLVDMPVNLIVTAHVYKTEDGEGEPLWYPGIQGKDAETANSIAGLMDAVGHYERKKLTSKKDPTRTRVVRRLWFDHPNYICGDKYGVLGSYVDNPTMPLLLSKIDGGEKAHA